MATFNLTDTTVPLRLRYDTGGATDVEFGVSSIGDLTITPDGGNITFAADVQVADGQGLVIGHTAQVAMAETTAEFQVLGTGSGDSAIGLGRFSADADGGVIRMFKSRTTIDGVNATVVTGDNLGGIRVYGDDGTDNNTASSALLFDSEGTIGVGQIPGIVRIQTAAAGTLADVVTFNSAKVSAFAGAVTMATTLEVTGTSAFLSDITVTDNSGDTVVLNKDSGPNIIFNKTDATAQSWSVAGEGSAFKIIDVTDSSAVALSIAVGTQAITLSSTLAVTTSTSSAFPNTVSGTGLMVTTNDGSVQEIMRDSSSLRFKTNPTEARIDVDAVLSIKPKEYGRPGAKGRTTGFIVEDFHDAGFRNLLDYDDVGPTGFLEYGRGITALQQAVLRSQDARIKDLEARLAA